MTIADLLIIGSVGYSLYVFVFYRRNISLSMASLGPIAVVLGLSLIALFYVADLMTMHVFPLFMPMNQAMAAMSDLYLNSFWIVALFGIGAISFGFAATNKNAARVVEILRDSEERYAVAVSGSNEGLWDWNIPTDESYFSPRWKQILGFEDHEIENVRQTFTDALHPDDRDQVMAAVRTHLETRVPYDAEFRLRHKDGRYVWIHSKGQAVWDEDGKPRRMAGSISDITGRKKAEEEIAKQSALLKTTFESMSQGIVVYDGALKVIAFNQKFVDLCDYPPDFVRLGMPFEDIVRFRARRGDYGPVADIEATVRQRAQARRDKETPRRERIGQDGIEVVVSRDIMPDGGYVATFTDITEIRRAEEALRESEARFRAVVENSPTKIHIKDAEGRYTLVNPVAEKLFGFTDQELRGKTSYDIFPKEVADAFTAHDRAVAESGEMAEEMERFTLEDGVHTYLTVKFPILDGQGEVAGVAAIGTDITARKQAEEETARKSALLETTFESMSQGICVHDADLELVAFNQHYVDLMGFPPGFLRLGMRYEEIARFKAERGHYGPGDVDEHVRERVLARRARKPNRKERTQPNGRVTLMRRDVLPDGGFVATYTDITERKKAEQALAERSEVLKTTFENMSQGVSVYDADLKLVAFNQKYVDLCDYPPDLVRLGMPFENIVRFRAQRGDYGSVADIETTVRERAQARWQGGENRSERILPDGRVIALRRDPMPHGGYVATFTDITERKRAEEALRASEERIRTVMDNMVDGITVIDDSGRIITVNPAGEKMFGYRCEEMLGRNVSMLMAEAEAKRHQSFLHRYLRAGNGKIAGIGPREVTGRRKEGTTFPIDLDVSEIRIGIKRLFVITTRDITERKRAEEALRESEQRFRDIAESASDWFWEMDAELRFSYFSERYAEITGFDSEERIGTTRNQFSSESDSAENAEKWAAHMADMEARRPFRNFEYATTASADGRMRHVRISGTPIFDAAGEFLGYRGTGTDITAEKKAEQALAEQSMLLQTTFENMSQGISVYDADLKLVAYNQNYVDLWRFPPGFVRLGMTFEEISRFKAERGDYGPGEVETSVKKSVAAMADAKALQPEYTAPDGNVFAVWRAPMPGGGIINTFTDITEIKRAEEQAVLANKTKSEFLAAMSHELRTPLNAILGFSELMGNATFGPLGNPKYQDYTKDINDSGRHLLGLINDILDISKIEAGKLDLDEEDIDIASALRSCMVLVKERAENGGVKLKTDISQDLPALHADKRKLKQILVNLLSNAVKFTPAGGEVTLKAWSRPDSGYVFQVIDTGIGMALADIPKALSLFGQVDSALDRKYEGTGLGLPLTKHLVEMHGGSLDLQSEEGAGTTVTVRFPKERIVQAPEIEATGSSAA